MPLPFLAVAKIASAPVSLKTAVASLVATDAYWSFVTFAQVESGGLSADTLVPAGLTTMVTGALIWVMRRVASGELVHRDPQLAQEALTKALQDQMDATVRLAEAMETVASESRRREDRLYQLLTSGDLRASE